MNLVDAHHHCWNLNLFTYPWMNGESTESIEKNFLPDDLLPILDQYHISKTILVQALDREEEAPFLLNLSEHYPFIAGVVIWLDMEDEKFQQHLNQYQFNPKFLGIRPMIQDIEDPNWMLTSAVKRAFEILQTYDKSFDFLIKPQHLPNAIQVVKQFPKQRFVIDHLSKPSIKTQEMEPWMTHIQEIASYPNVYCKLSGIITEANPQWKAEDLKPYIDVVVKAFGYDRLMFGSDWPVCLLAGDYHLVISSLKECLGPISKEEEEKIFGKNAIKFYNL